MYSQLRVWLDANHDGFSQASELESLEQAGVTRLDLDYIESKRLDEHGNSLRYLSKAWVVGSSHNEKPVKTSDVFFVTADE